MNILNRLGKPSFMILIVLFITYSCSQEESVSQTIAETKVNFAAKSVEILDELAEYFPKEDLVSTISKDKEGRLFAIYKLIGQTRDEIDLGSFAKREFKRNDGEGTTCDGKWSCGRLLYQCLANGDIGMISNGGCGENGNPDHYCVVCVPEEE
ncbi:MAG: Uncharacterised protein [Flavobacterium sp. SCGC AAA160-P02]|nr:MAG: Uncharacterised protein [Flavobacterium sp. SCGC AAA160-P02]